MSSSRGRLQLRCAQAPGSAISVAEIKRLEAARTALEKELQGHVEAHEGWNRAWALIPKDEWRSQAAQERREHTEKVWNEQPELRARIQRIEIAQGKVVEQNVFAAVGAGPNRFRLGWGS